jgi:hypothetical protein
VCPFHIRRVRQGSVSAVADIQGFSSIIANFLFCEKYTKADEAPGYAGKLHRTYARPDINPKPEVVFCRAF